METLTYLLSQVFLLAGSFLIFSGALGVLRFPDFFTRAHAAGVTDTLAATFIILGLMLIADWGLAQAKLIMIFLFLMITSPTACHALAKSALHGKLKPQDEQPDQESRAS